MGEIGLPAPLSQAIELESEDGHGGKFKYKAISLSTDEAPHVPVSKESKHILILGGGVSGLYVAWMLLDKGYRVTIIAEHWAWFKDFAQSRITSQIAGALWEYPPGGCGLTEIESPGSGWAGIEHYREWAMQSLDFYHRYGTVENDYETQGHAFGLSTPDLHQFFYHDVVSGVSNGQEQSVKEEAQKYEALKKEATDHPDLKLNIRSFNTTESVQAQFKNINTTIGTETLKSAYSHRTAVINTDKAMAYLMALVTSKGANFETRKLEGKISDFGQTLLNDHKAVAIVNATGLGAKELANDQDVYPVRGAIKRIENTRNGIFRHLNNAYLVPAQEDKNGFPTKTIFIVPRSDEVLYVGSIIQPNNFELLKEDAVEVSTMWNRAGQFMESLHQASTLPWFPFAGGLRPFTKRNVKVRADEGTEFPLVHNYGHGGSGWTLGIGTARCAVTILERLLAKEQAKTINTDLYGAH